MNPEPVLYEGETYTLEWTNLDGTDHNFATYDSSHNEITASSLMSTEGATQTVTFTVDPSMAEYDCQVHPGAMSGIITTVTQ
jgi:plastocyanin